MNKLKYAVIAVLILAVCSVGVFANVCQYEISPCDAIDISLTDARVIAFLDSTNMATVEVCTCKNYRGYYNTWLVNWHTRTQSQKVYVAIHTGEIVGTSPTPEPCWHTVTTFRGRHDKKTDTFNIKGDMWRMNWETTGSEEGSAISVYAYKETVYLTDTGTTLVDYLSQDTFPFGSDTYCVYDGPGVYYLHVDPTALEYWEVIVEDYY